MNNVIGILDFKPKQVMKASIKRMAPKKRQRLINDLKYTVRPERDFIDE